MGKSLSMIAITLQIYHINGDNPLPEQHPLPALLHDRSNPDHGPTAISRELLMDAPELMIYIREEDGSTNGYEIPNDATIGALRNMVARQVIGTYPELIISGEKFTNDALQLADVGIGAETVIDVVRRPELKIVYGPDLGGQCREGSTKIIRFRHGDVSYSNFKQFLGYLGQHVVQYCSTNFEQNRLNVMADRDAFGGFHLWASPKPQSKGSLESLKALKNAVGISIHASNSGETKVLQFYYDIATEMISLYKTGIRYLVETGEEEIKSKLYKILMNHEYDDNLRELLEKDGFKIEYDARGNLVDPKKK